MNENKHSETEVTETPNKLEEMLAELGHVIDKSILISAEEVDCMDDSTFIRYMNILELQIENRKKARDPLTLLRQRVSGVLQNQSISDLDKEELISELLRTFYLTKKRFHDQQSRIDKMLDELGVQSGFIHFPRTLKN